MKIILLITTFFSITIQALGQNVKIVTANTLNIRDGAGKEYTVIGQIHKGEKVNAIYELGDWTEIQTEDSIIGFVASEFLTNTTVEKVEAKNTATEEIGFKFGFFKAFQKFFIIVLLIFAGIEYYKSKRIKDGRYSKGFREIPFTTFEMIKFALYATIICSVIGLFMGIFYWIKSF